MFDPVFSKILVAFDGSDPSKRALDHAAKMAAMFESEIIIITVIPKIQMPVYSTSEVAISAVDLKDYDERAREIYSRALERAEADVRAHFPHLKTETVLVEGKPSELIVSEADKRNVSLIIMGSRGLGGISGWLLGSTSRKVVELCTKPILVVK